MVNLCSVAVGREYSCCERWSWKWWNCGSIFWGLQDAESFLWDEGNSGVGCCCCFWCIESKLDDQDCVQLFGVMKACLSVDFFLNSCRQRRRRRRRRSTNINISIVIVTSTRSQKHPKRKHWVPPALRVTAPTICNLCWGRPPHLYRPAPWDKESWSRLKNWITTIHWPARNDDWFYAPTFTKVLIITWSYRFT